MRFIQVINRLGRRHLRRRAGRCGGFLRDERGVTMIEFAIAGAVIFTLIFGIIQTGQALWERNTLQYAVSVAGRYAMAHSTASSATLVQQVDNAAPGLSTGLLSVTTASTAIGSTNFVTISATYPFSFLTAFLPAGTITLSAQSSVPLY